MDRRTFIGRLAGGVLATPLAARAQQPVVPVFGILLVFSRDAGKTFTDPIRAYMQALGLTIPQSLLLRADEVIP